MNNSHQYLHPLVQVARASSETRLPVLSSPFSSMRFRPHPRTCLSGIRNPACTRDGTTAVAVGTARAGVSVAGGLAGSPQAVANSAPVSTTAKKKCSQWIILPSSYAAVAVANVRRTMPVGCFPPGSVGGPGLQKLLRKFWNRSVRSKVHRQVLVQSIPVFLAQRGDISPVVLFILLP